MTIQEQFKAHQEYLKSRKYVLKEGELEVTGTYKELFQMTIQDKEHPFNKSENHAMFCEHLLKKIARQCKAGKPKKKLARETKLSRDEILYINKKFNSTNPYKEINVNKEWFQQIIGNLFFNYPNYIEEFEAFMNALEEQKEKQEILNKLNR